MENNFVDGAGIPMGFGMALAQNAAAMAYFSELSAEEKQHVIDGAKNVASSEEMQRFVDRLTQ